MEIDRHNWGTLQGVAGYAPILGGALCDLRRAESRNEAELAVERIGREIFATGLLCNAAPAVASSLVHMLWEKPPDSEDLVLGILVDIAESEVYEEDPDVYGRVTKAECLFEISLGFPAYTEILAASTNVSSLTACVDLVAWCGLFDGRLKDRSIYFLRSALVNDRLSGHTRAISAWIDELLDSKL